MTKVKIGSKKSDDISIDFFPDVGIKGDQIVPVITKSLREHGWGGTVRTLKLDCEQPTDCKASLAFDDKGQTTIFDFKFGKDRVGIAVSESTGGGPTTKSAAAKFGIVAGKVDIRAPVTVFEGQTKRPAETTKMDDDIMESLADGRMAAQAAVTAMKIEGKPAPVAPAPTADSIADAVAEKLKKAAAPAPPKASP